VETHLHGAESAPHGHDAAALKGLQQHLEELRRLRYTAIAISDSAHVNRWRKLRLPDCVAFIRL
jgi:hypothetical protein